MSNRRPSIPRLLDGVDPRAFPLTPIEGFVMSRVDGAATVHDLADLTNLEPGEVERVIGKLVELGVAEWADGAISLPRASMRPATPSDPSLRRPIAPPGPPPARPHITESQPPTATREPVHVRLPPTPRRPSSPYLERQSASDTVEPSRPSS
ncbi:MAG: hypothetical protein M3Y87_27735, partial [Myxococcota bacterium]|nr:hypothetical protein [Myxococcota bacterium]